MTSDLNASEPTWLGEKNLVLWLKGGEKGATSLIMADAENLEKKYAFYTALLEQTSILTLTGLRQSRRSMA